MALGDTLGVEQLTMVGKLTDAQVAMNDTDLTNDLTTDYNAKLTLKSLVIAGGQSLTVNFNRTIRKFQMYAPVAAA